MARTKQKRLLKVKELPNVFSSLDPDVKDAIWNYLKSTDACTLELGCGHGDYSVELAQIFPDRNFIGVDVKGARIFNGALKAIERDLSNAAFLIAKAEKLRDIFKQKSVEEIFIPFPDPHFRRANQNKRLISSSFLDMYKWLLTEDGQIHFKTDNQELFEYALKTISDFGCKIIFSSENLYKSEEAKFPSNVITLFEKYYLKEGRRIKYVCFKF
ncbi:MAG: tRNA (guanosine(46)-N7)-methyltransferase TrmB [Ignavibacteriaceae bacterium]|jgi:tRNA (guanine-N7-)-methyltransferase|nr:tRNA (guanosine(46)-N7)-methyltransferase TrmB [Ignavibacteriaceae bacterium]